MSENARSTTAMEHSTVVPHVDPLLFRQVVEQTAGLIDLAAAYPDMSARGYEGVPIYHAPGAVWLGVRGRQLRDRKTLEHLIIQPDTEGRALVTVGSPVVSHDAAQYFLGVRYAITTGTIISTAQAVRWQNVVGEGLFMTPLGTMRDVSAEEQVRLYSKLAEVHRKSIMPEPVTRRRRVAQALGRIFGLRRDALAHT